MIFHQCKCKLHSNYKTHPHFPPKFGGKVNLIVCKIQWVLFVVSNKEHILETGRVLLNKLVSLTKNKNRAGAGQGQASAPTRAEH